MIDMDFAQATFEYLVRKKITDGELPIDNSAIRCEDRYYKVDWKGLAIQQLWSELIDEDFIATIDEDKQELLFKDIINTFTQNISIHDPAIHGSEMKLSDLPQWYIVKNIPKKYYRG